MPVARLYRLALSHNQLSTLPARFSECISLRYLNIRGNQIKEFPMAVMSSPNAPSLSAYASARGNSNRV